MSKTNSDKSIVILGATGAVGREAVRALIAHDQTARLTLLGRRRLSGVSADYLEQKIVDIFAPDSYDGLLDGHKTAICTLGVGEPSKVSREDLVRVDKTAVIDFAKRCKSADIQHFQLLSSVGASTASKSFYLRTKGELEQALTDLRFARLSIFQPSMIITPQNRYGFTQALTLATWPTLSHLMHGGFKKYRGIEVDSLGRAIALNSFTEGRDEQRYRWSEFRRLGVR